MTHATKVYKARGRGRGATVTAVDDVSFTHRAGGGRRPRRRQRQRQEHDRQADHRIGAPDQRRRSASATSTSTRFAPADLRDYHRRVQMVFQDPYGALNPLHTVEYTVTRPCQNFLGLSAREARDRVHELLETVGLTPADAVRREAAAPALRWPAPARRDRPRARLRSRR